VALCFIIPSNVFLFWHQGLLLQENQGILSLSPLQFVSPISPNLAQKTTGETFYRKHSRKPSPLWAGMNAIHEKLGVSSPLMRV
jgi:hypothetical protein